MYVYNIHKNKRDVCVCVYVFFASISMDKILQYTCAFPFFEHIVRTATR